MTWQKPLKVSGIIENLKQKIASLQERWYGARREIEQLRKENEQLRRREKQLEREQEQWRRQEHRLRQEQERLRQENEKLSASWKKLSGATNGRRRLFPADCGGPIPSDLGASPVPLRPALP